MTNNKTFANNAGIDGVGIRATVAILPPVRGYEGSQPKSRGKRKISPDKRLSSSIQLNLKPMLFFITVI